ncbi:MAG: hypothetical protein WA814_11560 [Candidatus Baltobacteraceae bacterium]
MKPRSIAAVAFAFVAVLAGGAAPAETILYSFTGLPGQVDACKWFVDNLNTDRSVDALTRQTDLLYNRIALPAGESVAIQGHATTLSGSPLVDFTLGRRTICTGADAIYGPTPEPSAPASGM